MRRCRGMVGGLLALGLGAASLVQAAPPAESTDTSALTSPPADETVPASIPPVMHAGISGNPAATNDTTGTGWLGRTLGIPEDTGVALGGLYMADVNTLFTGGAHPHRSTGNSLLIIDFHEDFEKSLGWKGSSLGAEFLQYNGGPTTENFGTVQGPNSLEANTPLDRSELYQFWFRQELFGKLLKLRVGKSITSVDFNNVLRPVNRLDENLNIPSVSGLLYTPVFVNSSMLGVLPGYYDSAYGIVANITPYKRLYINVGVYDGNGARGVRTGNLMLPQFTGYYFTIGEIGYDWLLGEEHKPGIAAVGAWNQSGSLGTAGGPQEDGCQGVYGFASQQLWYQNPGKSNAGLGGFFQWGWNGSKTLPMNWYLGAGLTAFGLVPNRPDDTLGMGLAWAGLNSNLFQRDTELLVQTYYQAQLFDSVCLQPALTFSPAPGGSPTYNAAVSGTLRLLVLF